MWGPEQTLEESRTALQISAGLGFLLVTLLFAFGAALRTRLQQRLPACFPVGALTCLLVGLTLGLAPVRDGP
jgi:hypothetical protein